MTGIAPARVAFLASTMCCTVLVAATSAQTREPVIIRGRPQVLHLYGARGGTPIIVSSGDGGWIHLGPHVAEFLSTRGFYVIGFDVRAYLSSFTTADSTL